MKQLPIDPNGVWQKVMTWDQPLNEHPKQITVPNFQITTDQSKVLINVPPTYIHENIIYPDENNYSCDEEDLANNVDALMLQQLDIRRNLNHSRNYSRQLDLLNGVDYPLEYYQQKTERLQRPLLRVFMRAQENDYRMNMAFRPSRVYKQKRQKRLNLNLPEFLQTHEVMHIENQIALQLLLLIRHREQLKLKLIQAESQQVEYTLPTLNSDTLFLQLKELRRSNEDDLVCKEQRNRIYETCSDPDCGYQFTNQKIMPQLIEYMDDQYTNIKQLYFPKNPTVLTSWNVDNFTKLGVHQNNQQLIYNNNHRTLIISDRTKKNKKKVKLMLVDRNRSSVFDGVRASYEHFYSHYLKAQNKSEIYIESIRRETQRNRQELQRKEQLLRIQQKKEEQRALLKFRLNLSIIKEPAIKKTVKIKHSEDTRFWLVLDDCTRILLKQENGQVFLK